MSFRRYPEYKESGVDWLGEVPKHWSVTSLKRGYKVRLGKMLQPASTSPTDELFPYLRAANIQWSGIDASDVKVMWFSPTEAEQLSLRYGDLLVSEGGDVGRSALWRDEIENCRFQNSVNRVRGLSANSTNYLRYWMAVIKDKGYIDVLCNKSTIAHFTAEKVQAVPVPFPPAAEQTAISAFLDRETGKIDTLVAEQEKLIALLKEKRQAVISHAVTKGLNPDAPMKPSGIEWLGDVSAHWMICTARRVVVRIEQGWSPECVSQAAEPNEWGVLKAGCVNRGVFVESENKALPPHLEPMPEYEVREGDVLMSRASGSPELVGSVAFVSKVRPHLMLSDKIFRLAFRENVTPRYFVALFNSRLLRMQIEQAISGAEGLANNLPQSSMKDFLVSLPPLDEQVVIVAFLDRETARLNALTAEAERAINLLKERRSALISAAVTGQIDVRGLASTAVAPDVQRHDLMPA